MLETYVILKDEKIIRVYETSDGISGVTASMKNEGISGSPVKVLNGFEGNVGQVKNEFTKDWKMRPLDERVAEGLVKIQKDETVDRGTGKLRKKTNGEKLEDGTLQLDFWQRYDGLTDRIVTMSWLECIDNGKATYQDWLSAVVRPYRDRLLNTIDLVYCNPERWAGYSDQQKTQWSAYKQALRDITKSKLEVVDDPEQIPLPARPE